MGRHLDFLASIILSLGARAAGAASAPGTEYRAGPTIVFGGQGGWDYVSLDATSERLFVSHGDRVVVIDTARNKVIKEISGTPGVHGIALAPDLNKAFTSDGKEGKVGVINLGELTVKSKIAVGQNPDAIVYDPARKAVYAFNGKSHSVSVIDAESERVTATLSLPGKPEFAAVDPAADRVFVNVEDKNEILAIDTQGPKVVATWPLENCESPSGLAIDVKNHRLFSVCENEKMVMVDSMSGRNILTVPTGRGTDAAAFDAGSGLVFSSNGKSGTVTIAREESPDRLTVVQNLKTQVSARTMAVNPKDHRIFLPAAELKAGQKASDRPQPVEGSQKILTFEP